MRDAIWNNSMEYVGEITRWEAEFAGSSEPLLPADTRVVVVSASGPSGGAAVVAEDCRKDTYGEAIACDPTDQEQFEKIWASLTDEARNAD